MIDFSLNDEDALHIIEEPSMKTYTVMMQTGTVKEYKAKHIFVWCSENGPAFMVFSSEPCPPQGDPCDKGIIALIRAENVLTVDVKEEQ